MEHFADPVGLGEGQGDVAQQFSQAVGVGQMGVLEFEPTAPVLYIEAAHRLADMNLFAELCPQLITAKAVG